MYSFFKYIIFIFDIYIFYIFLLLFLFSNIERTMLEHSDEWKFDIWQF